jgi:hypothetical protein
LIILIKLTGTYYHINMPEYALIICRLAGGTKPNQTIVNLGFRSPGLTPAFVVSGSTNMRILAGSVHYPILSELRKSAKSPQN